MKFDRNQLLEVPVDVAITAFADPVFALAAVDHGSIGEPELIIQNSNPGRVHLEVRYRFIGDLNAAARAVLDPAKLTWVQVSDHDLDRGLVVFSIRPDHYPDRLTCQGRYRLIADTENEERSRRILQCEVKVRAPLVGGQVERVLVDGMNDELDEQAGRLAAWAADN